MGAGDGDAARAAVHAAAGCDERTDTLLRQPHRGGASSASGVSEAVV